MALLLRENVNFFVYNNITIRYYRQGAVSYFDPIERKFLWIYPSKGDVAQENWIPLPLINDVDLIKKYLHLSIRDSILQKYEDLDDLKFIVAILELAEEYGFEDSLSGYLTCYYHEIMLKWAEDNNIPNCKLGIERPLCTCYTREEAKKFMDYCVELARQEELQEEEFKKSMRQQAKTE